MVEVEVEVVDVVVDQCCSGWSTVYLAKSWQTAHQFTADCHEQHAYSINMRNAPDNHKPDGTKHFLFYKLGTQI